MTSRSLTEVFVLMRNNAVQSRNIYSEQGMNDNQRLIKRSSRDPELGLEMRAEFRTPPEWLDKLEEAHYFMTKVRSKLEDLHTLHETVLTRPGLEEECVEENQIEGLTNEISRLLSSVHRYIQHIESCKREGTRTEQVLTGNVALALGTILQQLSSEFNVEQNRYLSNLRSRELSHKSFFDTPDFGMTDISLPQGNQTIDSFFNNDLSDSYLHENSMDESIDKEFQKPINSRMSQQQLLLFEEENTKMVEHREKEVNKIVQSISDLNDIFKDLAHMVSDQGTVLDRIDYNIEQTQTQVVEGYMQLRKADTYQRKNRKMFCIMVLAGVTLFMLILLIVVKS